MSMFLFMPWCPINKRIKVGDIRIVPFKQGKRIRGAGVILNRQIERILSSYKTIEGQPISRAAFIQLSAKGIGEDLTEDEIELLNELVALLIFCGLSNRAYFNHVGSYCNTDCFTMYIQKFEDAEFTAISSRRREGRTLSGWGIDEIAITVPVHCHTIGNVTVDERLLRALVSRRTSSSSDDWGRWQNAISCFNQANTDNDSVRYQVEWVHFCSAFEHLLGASPDARDVAERFSRNLVPNQEISVAGATRRSPRWQNGGKAIRYEWMREFYRVRGDFAHGRLRTRQPLTWNPLEHLVLATIAFPLVVKSLLAKTKGYRFTTEDLAQIDSFERLADTADFLRPPADRKGSMDSHWARILRESKWTGVSKQMVETLKKMRNRSSKTNGATPSGGSRQPDDSQRV